MVDRLDGNVHGPPIQHVRNLCFFASKMRFFFFFLVAGFAEFGALVCKVPFASTDDESTVEYLQVCERMKQSSPDLRYSTVSPHISWGL